MNEVQEQFLKTLESLKALAKTKKNTLEYDEILNAFAGIDLTEDKMDMILEYLEKNHVDILQGKSPDDPGEDLLLESEEDILLSDNEEIELISDVDVLEDGRTRTLEEVGKKFNVTRERIRQIEAKALRKLRHPSRSERLKDFLT